MSIMRFLKILWALLLVVVTFVYIYTPLRFYLLISTGLGILVWVLVGSFASSKGAFRAWFNLLRVIVPKSREHVEAESGTFLAVGEIPEKIGWKEAFLEEGINKSFLPVLLMFGILQYVLKFQNVQSVEQLINLSFSAFFSPIYVCPITFLWALLDSKWIEYDRKTNKVIRVGEHVLLYLRSIAGISALLGLISVLYASFGAGAALLFPILTLAIASAPIYITTVIYVKFFHYKYVKRIYQYLLLEKKLPIARINIVPVTSPQPSMPYIETQEKIKVERHPTVAYKFCPYCRTQIPSDARFCPKCGSSLEVE